jgi:hypothetical protein
LLINQDYEALCRQFGTEERPFESHAAGRGGGEHAKNHRTQDAEEQEHAANTDLAMLLIHDDGLQFIRLVQHLSRGTTHRHAYTQSKTTICCRMVR